MKLDVTISDCIVAVNKLHTMSINILYNNIHMRRIVLYSLYEFNQSVPKCTNQKKKDQ